MPQMHDRDLARMALAVYDPEGGHVGEWSRLNRSQLIARAISPSSLEQPKCGFRAAIFTDGTRYVMAFAGTDEFKEVITNVAQAAGFSTHQYEAAVKIGRRVKLAFGAALCFTGHSLGGGLAGIAACSTDTPAVTFNAAGLHRSSYLRVSVEPGAARAAASEGQIRAYAVNGEILTKAQDCLPIPKPPGARIRLEDPEPLTGFRSMLPLTRIARSIRLHSMATVVKAVEADSRFRNPPPEATALLNKADAVLAKSGLSDRSIERVRTALERRVATEVAANRFPPSAPAKDQGRFR